MHSSLLQVVNCCNWQVVLIYRRKGQTLVQVEIEQLLHVVAAPV